MCETIYVEKNKSSRFGIHFYEDSTRWNVFCSNCGIANHKYAVICNTSLLKEEWHTLATTLGNILTLDRNDSTVETKIRNFIDDNKDCTFILFSEPFIMEAMQTVITSDDSKLSYVIIPVTPFAFFDAVSLRPQTDKTGELTRKELFPLGVYVDISIFSDATTEDFIGGIAAAFRLAISYKTSMFEWMIYHLYELLDCEKEDVIELLSRGYMVHKERIEKDTAKERALPIYGLTLYKFFAENKIASTEADLWALAMVCQSYLSWKSGLLSMEEYYEIRDMFVAFGLAITETEISDKILMELMTKSKYNLLKEDESVLIRKIGKIILHESLAKEKIEEAFGQIYFDEESND